MHKIILILFFVLMSSACGESEPRRPINKQKQIFLKESAKRNKSKMNIEQNLFNKVIKKETTLKFNSSPLGFWYAFKKKVKFLLKNQSKEIESPLNTELKILIKTYYTTRTN